MRSLIAIGQLLAATSLLNLASAKPLSNIETRWGKKCIKPKVFIIDMFPPEGDAWYGIPEFNLLAKNITVPGISPIYPDVHCTADEEVCQIVTGESGGLTIPIYPSMIAYNLSEINAANSINALTFSGLFNFTTTYFFIAGIAGINPKVATLGSVTFAKYAVQVALQYEFDAREIPSNFTTG